MQENKKDFLIEMAINARKTVTLQAKSDITIRRSVLLQIETQSKWLKYGGVVGRA